MSDQSTTIRIGFKTDTHGLTQASHQVSRLQRELRQLERTSRAIESGSGGFAGVGGDWRAGGAGGMAGIGRGPLGGAGRMALRGGAGAFAALGLAVGTIGVITRAVSEAKQYLSVLDPLSKQLSIVGYGQEQFARGLEQTGVAIGKNKTEMARLTQMYIAMSGQQRGDLGRQIDVSALFAKGMGIDQNLMASTMGGMAQMGAFGQYGGMRVERFAAVLADAITRGGMKGREGEFFSSIQSLMGAQLNVLTRLAPGSGRAMIGALTAMNASGNPGLMGARGAGLLGRINAAFMNPQGDFGEYFMYNALGGGNYFDYKMRLERGIFGDGNLQSVMNHMRSSVGDDKSRWYTMSKMFGISMDQARALEGLDLRAGGGGFLSALEQSTGGNLGTLGADKLGLMAEIYNTGGARRGDLLKDSRIAALARERGWTADTDIQDIFRGIAGQDLVETTQEKMLTELTKIDNTIHRIGEAMIPKMADILRGVNSIASYFDNNEADAERRGSGPMGFAATPGGAAINLLSGAAGRAKDSSAYEVGEQVVVGLKDAWSPVVAGFDKLFSELGRLMRFEIKVTDERAAGDGSAVKVQQ